MAPPTPQEYKEDLDRQLKAWLITPEAYRIELAALRLAEQIIKD
jgi:hypothetical protein